MQRAKTEVGLARPRRLRVKPDFSPRRIMAEQLARRMGPLRMTPGGKCRTNDLLDLAPRNSTGP